MNKSYKLSEYPKLVAFLHNQEAATLAVPIDDKGTIHIASLLFWNCQEPFRFYFVTSRETEKCRLLKAALSVAAACTVGTIKEVEMTLQMRGELQIVEPEGFEDVLDAYYEKRGDRHDDIDDPINALLEFTPTWARFTDYGLGYDRFTLDLTTERAK